MEFVTNLSRLAEGLGVRRRGAGSWSHGAAVGLSEGDSAIVRLRLDRRRRRPLQPPGSTASVPRQEDRLAAETVDERGGQVQHAAHVVERREAVDLLAHVEDAAGE